MTALISRLHGLSVAAPVAPPQPRLSWLSPLLAALCVGFTASLGCAGPVTPPTAVVDSDDTVATTALTDADTAQGSAAPRAAGADVDSGGAGSPDAAGRRRAARPPRPIPQPAVLPGVPKIVAIGDLHGDITATRAVLKLAGAIDDADHWIGGKLVVVQVGDQLDRGDGEKAILLLLDSVADQAHQAGGALHVLNGNHETMNVAQQFGYVTPGGWLDFADVPHVPNDALLGKFAPHQRGRVSALRPGGPYAKLLAGHNTIQVIGDTVFVHGGVLPQHVTYGIAKINQEISAWMNNQAPAPQSISSETSPVWSRHYSLDVDAEDCKLAAQALAALHVKRMVVAHTVQSKGINSVCGGLVWRIDVGISKHYGGLAQVLVVEGASVVIAK